MNESNAEAGLESLQRPDARLLTGVGRTRNLPASSLLCAEGQVMDRFFVVTAGQFEIAKCIAGQRHTLSISGPGSVLADPVAGQKLGIILIEAGVGMTVCGVLLSIYHAFSRRGRAR